MAIARRFKITHDEVFPHGAYLISEVGPVFDFERSTKENKVQQVDKDTGLLLWSVDVLEADPDAGRKSRTVSVKIAAKHQPVPPAPDPALAVPASGVRGAVGAAVHRGVRQLLPDRVVLRGGRLDRPDPRPARCAGIWAGAG